MIKKNISKERQKYLNNIKKKRILVIFTQLSVLITFLFLWEILANKNIIDSFITSKPSRIINTLINLNSNDLMKHVFVTVYETLVGFSLGAIMGISVAIVFWWSKFLAEVAEPYLVVLNSLPKVALRTYYYNMGWSRDTSNNNNGNFDFINCYNFRKFKWICKNR